MLVWTLVSCVSSGKLLTFSVQQFPYQIFFILTYTPPFLHFHMCCQYYVSFARGDKSAKLDFFLPVPESLNSQLMTICPNFENIPYLPEYNAYPFLSPLLFSFPSPCSIISVSMCALEKLPKGSIHNLVQNGFLNKQTNK